MYSKILQDCTTGKGSQLLIAGKVGNNVTYGFPVLYNEFCVFISFDPWTGTWIEESFDDSYFNALYDLAKRNKQYNELWKKNFDMGKEDPAELKGREWFFKMVAGNRKLHAGGRYCQLLETNVRYGSRGDTSLIEIPAIRVIAVLNKLSCGGWNNEQFDLFHRRNDYFGLESWEFSGWTAIDYCPFCGAKLPDKLDKQIIDTLEQEYELRSWQDYKKAPYEFHYDEWWRKRGL